MKIWIAYILSFYILLSAIVPCSIFDQCDEEECVEQTCNTDQKKDCSGCSPFSICASGFTFKSMNTFEPIVFHNLSSYSEYYFAPKSQYDSSLFEPPRVV